MVIEHSILFVCTGNTCRSPMAEALFNSMNSEAGWIALSGGISANYGDCANELAVETMQMDFDLDLNNHRSRPLFRDLMSMPEWILTMTTVQRDILRRSWPELAEHILTVGEFADQPELQVADPIGHGLAAYRAVAATLAGLMPKIIARIA